MIELGILADDLTGGMMVASLLEREGISCPLVSSIDELESITDSDAQAVVVARKIRLIAPDDARLEAVSTVKALQSIGCKRFYYKYCATFDSTTDGNIGPIAEAMLETLNTKKTVFCPAFPEYTVTIFQGRMFIGSTPLGDSFKQNDPVTPMTNSNLVEVLQSQTSKHVGLISHSMLIKEVESVRSHINKMSSTPFFIADAADDEDLRRLAELTLDWKLTTGADALPIFLARAWQKHNHSLKVKESKRVLSPSPGAEVFIAGSCAAATLRQVDTFEKNHPTFRVDLVAANDDPEYVSKIIIWAKQHIDKGPIAVSSSADLDELSRTQKSLGVGGAASLADKILGEVAHRLFKLGARKFVVAGGETSGQVINSIGIKKVEVSAFDELGGGYCHQSGSDPISFVLKAGALGNDNFFFDAMDRMRQAENII